MGFHTFDPAETDRLEDPSRFRFCSREELLQYLPPDGRVLDIGSGSGYYTDEIAPFVERVVALDIQPAMHGQYRARGLPPNVSTVASDAETLPLAEDSLDGAFSTMTYHESASPAGAQELGRVLAPGAPVVVVDWSSDGQQESGPPLSERYSANQAREQLAAAGFRVVHAAERSETFHLLAHAPEV
jgi:ubiquinone/menaquinone biosynthesis C-methylase UbiE